MLAQAAAKNVVDPFLIHSAMSEVNINNMNHCCVLCEQPCEYL